MKAKKICAVVETDVNSYFAVYWLCSQLCSRLMEDQRRVVVFRRIAI